MAETVTRWLCDRRYGRLRPCVALSGVGFGILATGMVRVGSKVVFWTKKKKPRGMACLAQDRSQGVMSPVARSRKTRGPLASQRLSRQEHRTTVHAALQIAFDAKDPACFAQADAM
jgi:hypothetical protein